MIRVPYVPFEFGTFMKPVVHGEYVKPGLVRA